MSATKSKTGDKRAARPAVQSRITSRVETITPEIAEEMLGHNSHNRTLRNRAVAELAGAIARGEWMMNGDAIRFAADGTLLDGQHRLWAIVEAEKPVDTIVIRGLPMESQGTMDIGARRRLSDMLTLRGEANATVLAAVLNYFWRLDNGYVRTPSKKPTPQQALALLDDHPAIRDFARSASAYNRRFRISTAMVGAVWYQLDTIDSDDAAEFFRLLDKGSNLDEDSPIFRLRRWLETQSVAGAGSRANALTTHALLVKAWNAWRDGINIQRLNWKASGTNAEAFPEPH